MLCNVASGFRLGCGVGVTGHGRAVTAGTLALDAGIHTGLCYISSQARVIYLGSQASVTYLHRLDRATYLHRLGLYIRVVKSHHKFMLASYMKQIAKFLALLHHNASFFNFCIII